MLARLIEADRQQREDFDRARAKAKADLIQYWSDPKHLEDKLRKVTETIAQSDLLPMGEIAQIAILPGTGDLVLPQPDGKLHYIDIDVDGNPLYIAPQATLPVDQKDNLRTLASFKPAA